MSRTTLLAFRCCDRKFGWCHERKIFIHCLEQRKTFSSLRACKGKNFLRRWKNSHSASLFSGGFLHLDDSRHLRMKARWWIVGAHVFPHANWTWMGKMKKQRKNFSFAFNKFDRYFWVDDLSERILRIGSIENFFMLSERFECSQSIIVDPHHKPPPPPRVTFRSQRTTDDKSHFSRRHVRNEKWQHCAH